MDITDYLGMVSHDMEALPKFRTLVRQRDAANKCLLCDAKSARRGLCNKHYYAYRMEWLQTPRNQRLHLEAKLIRNGKLMPDRQGQRIERPTDAESKK